MSYPSYGLRTADRVAALGVAAAWSRRSKARQATQAVTVGGSVANLLDDPQYPQSFEDFIGQEPAKATILAALARAQHRGERMRHTLIAWNEPGGGKTALAVLIARQIGGRCFTISGTPNWQQARTLILSTRPGDVLFIDEIHRLVKGGKANAEWLLHVLQDDALVGPMGIEKAHLGLTVVAATTDKGRLPQTILDRFMVQPQMVPYDDDEAGKITLDYTYKVFPPMEPPPTDDLWRITSAADCNPRKIKALVDLALDSCYEAAGYDLDRVLARAGMTDDGLDWTEQRYLACLRQSMGPMGESQLRNILGEATLTYEERRLNEKGLIAFSRSGRTLTAAGIERANELVEAGVGI